MRNASSDSQVLHLKFFRPENFINVFHNSAFGITAFGSCVCSLKEPRRSHA
jgi:hypothetical protein